MGNVFNNQNGGNMAINIIEEINKAGFTAFQHPGEDIKVSCEDGKDAGIYYPDDCPEFGIYDQDPWINPDVIKVCKKYGYGVDWYDPGSLVVYKEVA
jgi:hypothetical protein